MAIKGKGKSTALWQVLKRPDLKRAFAVASYANVHSYSETKDKDGRVIDREDFVTPFVSGWRFADPENRETCAQCSKPLRGARVCVVGPIFYHDGDGATRETLGLAHRGCMYDFMAAGFHWLPIVLTEQDAA